jgi:hypothetical protein
MIPALLPALERHGRLTMSGNERVLLLSVSAATIDRMLVDALLRLWQTEAPCSSLCTRIIPGGVSSCVRTGLAFLALSSP